MHECMPSSRYAYGNKNVTVSQFLRLCDLKDFYPSLFFLLFSLFFLFEAAIAVKEPGDADALVKKTLFKSVEAYLFRGPPPPPPYACTDRPLLRKI